MTSNIPKPQNTNLEEDIISNLPEGVIECIMNFLPVRDAARTCVLSTNWRFVWANHPSLVLDTGFWKDILPSKSPKIYSASIVGSILDCHAGDIRKFAIDVSSVSSNIDLWLYSLCRRRLKVLDLKNSDRDNRYKVPSWVFLRSELTHLSLFNCKIKQTVGCFTNIQSLFLEGVKFDSVVITAPLLTSLTIKKCFTTHHLDISAPRLESLTFDSNYSLHLKPFVMCTNIEYACLCSNYGEKDGKHLVELLASWPKLSVLVVDESCFRKLATGSAPDNDDDILPLNLRSFVLRHVNLDFKRIVWILYLLKNSPLLQTFKIQFGSEEMNDIDEPSMVDFKMDRLRTVVIKDFIASRNEVMFVKILLKCAPLLGKLLVEKSKYFDCEKIAAELFLLQKKYPNTKIIYAPNLVPV